MEMTKDKSRELVDKPIEIIQQKRKKKIGKKPEHVLHTKVSNNYCHQSLRREKSSKNV